MKYIDAELLKTELKRRIKERDNMMKLGTYFSTSYVYEDILDLIDSLQQEQKSAEWSEEDEAMRDNILRLLSCFVGTSECDSNPSLSTSYPAYQREIDWLKSLHPQKRAKGNY